MAAKVFDGGAAQALVAELRRSYGTNRSLAPEWREQQLRAVIRMTEENEGAIIDALHKDTGKSRTEAYQADVHFVKADARDMLKNLRKWMKPQRVGTDLVNFPARCEIRSDPLGVVLIISTWNYAYMLSLQPVLGAIVAGNAAVLKPSELAPATSNLLGSLIPRYLDTQFFKVVEGGVPETTALLEVRWDKIMYTGNSRVARIISMAAARHLTPLILELGGKNPVFIDSSADLTTTAKRIVVTKLANLGQVCLAPDYCIVEEEIASKLVEKLRETLRNFYGEDPSSSPDLARIVNEGQFARLEALLAEDGVSNTIVHTSEHKKKQLFIAPTILRDVPWSAAIMQEEIFGPLLPIQTVKDVQEAIAIINERPKPLALYAFTSDKSTQELLLSRTSSGAVLINDCVLHTCNNSLPFGGVGESGMGSYHAKASFDAFSHKKSVMVKTFMGDVPARFPPGDSYKDKFVRAFLGGHFFLLILMALGLRK